VIAAESPLAGRHLALYLTGEHDCSYLPGLKARTLFVDPTARIDSATYQALVDQGFRRSGAHVYRPACRGCSACIPVRVPVEAFVPDRSQRRNWRRNASELSLVDTPAAFLPSHFELYRRYLTERHPEGSMADRCLRGELSTLSGRAMGRIDPFHRDPTARGADRGGGHGHPGPGSIGRLHLLRPERIRTLAGHLCDPGADRGDASARPALSLSGLLAAGLRRKCGTKRDSARSRRGTGQGWLRFERGRALDPS
jgi:hypothetical protein